MKNFDPKYNDIPKTEIHVHLEGAIRTSTIIDIAKEHNLELPAFDVVGLDPHVKVYDQWESLDAVLEAFNIAQRSIASPQAFERIAWEFFEDSARQNVKLLEVSFSPDWAFSSHDLDWDAALDGLLRAKAKAEKEFGMAIGLIAITSRSMGAGSCEKTVDWAIRHKDVIHGIDLADSEILNPISEFVTPVLRAKDAGLGITIHSGEDTPASAVIETIQAVGPERIGHGIHIIEDMKAGIDPAKKNQTMAITNRKEAIAVAYNLARPGDMILIAGKGHEKYQEIQGVKHPFDDKQVITELMQNIS